ncbi:MAG: AAA family ATPase [Gammaproteobacteria bacterium]|nr:AAA family ATPase [Gammaproteobacteria bacterium]
MYTNYHRLSCDPFQRLSDQSDCCLKSNESRVRARLENALLHGEGIVVVTGADGSGKAALAERLVAQCDPERAFNVRLSARGIGTADILHVLAAALGLHAEHEDRSILPLLIQRYLAEISSTRHRLLVVIEQAHELSSQSLDSLRLLTLLRAQACLLQFILLGRGSLASSMNAPGMESLREQVIANCRLQPMDLAQTRAYIECRLNAANWSGDPVVDGQAVLAIYRCSRGVGQNIDKLCSRLLLRGDERRWRIINGQHVQIVARELGDKLPIPLSLDEMAHCVGAELLDAAYELALVPSEVPDSQPLHKAPAVDAGRAPSIIERALMKETRRSPPPANKATPSTGSRTRSLVRAIARL